MLIRVLRRKEALGIILTFRLNFHIFNHCSLHHVSGLETHSQHFLPSEGQTSMLTAVLVKEETNKQKRIQEIGK